MTDEVGAGAEALDPGVSETHISTVFFSADRAFKLLKPVRTSFLDQSTVELRLRAVDVEIALNRRMAPDVYLGSADVIEHGELVDRMLVMRRLPSERRLTGLLDRNAEIGDCLRAIARRIAVFHAAEVPVPDAVDAAGRDAVAGNWRDNFTDLESLRGEVIPAQEFDSVRGLVEGYLAGRGPLFQARIDEGFVRDGHGDLTAQDIFCLDDGPRILDCLAFDRRLRVGDVLIDVAFLAMDLDRLAGVETSSAFLGWYGEFSNEHHPSSLVHHYIAYRAHVRAKVAAIRHRQGDATSTLLVQSYHKLCLHHLERANVMLTLVGGTPGTGKTTLSRALAAPLDAMVLGTDELRKDLAGRGHLVRELSLPDEGIYAPDMSERTYSELLHRASKLLEQGESVVLDASWNNARHRRAAAELALAKGADLVELECVLDPHIARERIAARLLLGTDPSDARPELVDELRRRHEPWPTATAVNTVCGPEDAVSALLNDVPAFRRRTSPEGETSAGRSPDR